MTHVSIGRTMSRPVMGLLLAVGIFLPGCDGGSGPKLNKVTGHVKFENEPVAEGRINFRAADGKGATYSGAITGGKYTADCEAGSYKVEIMASRKTGKFTNTVEGKNEVEEMYIPAKYNSQTTLTKEVPKGGGEINFDLTK
ncbi:hypothetical protein [Zavarzinella formosa]|uniref:hypothetical protein n=1 Tax=Zavarzinella formosa TaxID=360055 RepID=UPI0002D9A1E0|nr:hypothetical protein [Zavarzinella formosa]